MLRGDKLNSFKLHTSEVTMILEDLTDLRVG